MEKLQVILETIRKYHFWLLSVLAVVASLVGWMKARGTLSDEYTKGKAAIEEKFGSLEQIQMTEFPANGTWKDEIAKLTDQERKEVASAWQKVYHEQQKVLEWPEEILGPDFVKWIAGNKPDAVIPQNWCMQYRDDVANVEFPKLLKRVDAELKTEDGKQGDAAPEKDAAAPVEHEYKVIWEQDNQRAVQDALEMKDKDEGEPSTLSLEEKLKRLSLEVRLRQEDLWVFRALLDIIHTTNESARFTSHVKQIKSLTIGVEAAKKFQEGLARGKIDSVTKPSNETPQQQAREPEPTGEVAPDQGRYVDEAGTPLGSGVAATEQFKRLPVYMNLVMNQREINGLLTHCANYPLPVEVKQLRINPEDSEKERTRKPAEAQGGDKPSPTAIDPFDVTVEIHGIIYLYNPPDQSKLGQPAGESAASGG